MSKRMLNRGVLLSLDNENAYMAEADMALENVMKRRRGDLTLQDNGRSDMVQVDIDQKIEEEEKKSKWPTTINAGS